MSGASPDLFEFARLQAVVPANPEARPLGEACEEAQRLWEVIERDCQGMDNACVAADLGLRAGIKVRSSKSNRGRKVRDLISKNLDVFPDLVVATPAGGYYVPASPEELERSHGGLRSRQIQTYQRELAVIRVGKAKGWTYKGEGRWTA